MFGLVVGGYYDFVGIGRYEGFYGNGYFGDLFVLYVDVNG